MTCTIYDWATTGPTNAILHYGYDHRPSMAVLFLPTGGGPRMAAFGPLRSAEPGATLRAKGHGPSYGAIHTGHLNGTGHLNHQPGPTPALRAPWPAGGAGARVTSQRLSFNVYVGARPRSEGGGQLRSLPTRAI